MPVKLFERKCKNHSGDYKGKSANNVFLYEKWLSNQSDTPFKVCSWEYKKYIDKLDREEEMRR